MLHLCTCYFIICVYQPFGVEMIPIRYVKSLTQWSYKVQAQLQVDVISNQCVLDAFNSCKALFTIRSYHYL